MARDGFKVMDSDMHLIEPPDLWERYIDKPYKNVAPVGLAERTADLRLVVQGRQMPSGQWGTPKPEQAARREKLMDRYAEAERRGWTGKVQIDAMDTEGIDAAGIFPSRGLYALGVDDLDPGFAAAIARAYNNWLYAHCNEGDPTRMLGAGMLPPHDVNAAIAEARRCVEKLGFRAVFFRPNPVRGRNWHDAYFDPLWSCLEDLGAGVAFHEGLGPLLPQVGDRFGDDPMLRHIACHSMEMMLATISFCAGGVLERHPRLRVAFLEGYCSWVPWALQRMDEHWELNIEVGMWPSLATELTKEPPSAYFKRQAYVSVEADETFVAKVIEWMDNRAFVFSTDWPHADGKYPYAVESFLGKMPLSDADKRKILWDNCARFYGIE